MASEELQDLFFSPAHSAAHPATGDLSDDPSTDDLILGASQEIVEAKRIISRVAKTDVTVLLRGESGTGKELAAQSIYRGSSRGKKPFVKVLCAAIPEGLLESELFGFEKGAFTGAHRKNPGKFEFANHGTIFLDEIGDIPQSLQAKLLQVLQDGEFSRIGGREVKVNTRIIAATNRNLEKAVAQGVFREDLFYRLNVVSVVMPPLRKRKSDISILADFFTEKFSKQYNKPALKISATAMDKMTQYSWPGNVRELENCIKRMIVLGSDQFDFPSNPPVGDTPAQPVPESASAPELKPARSPGTGVKEQYNNLKEVVRMATRKAEEETIRRVLEETRWNRRKAARILGVSYKTLLQKLKLCNLEG